MENLEQKYKESGSWGMTASLDIYDCDRSIITDPVKIKDFIVKLCEKVDMKRYGEPLIERFAEGSLEGYSAMQFIETSSITMHFDEIENRAFIDIFTCKFFVPEEGEKFCLNYLKGSSSKLTYFFRK